LIKEYLKYMTEIYEFVDALMIVNKEGIVEYSTIFSDKQESLKNEEITGKHILEVYPSLTEKTSSVLRVLKTKKTIINEKQKVVDFRGKELNIINFTHPIEYNGEIIGAVEASVFEDKYNRITKQENRLYTLDDIITKNSKMLEIKNKIERIAKTNSSVLIYGDTGTGKEMVAQAIHSHSSRKKEPFISQNCSAIPGTLLESILFGTVKGSYTGAENKKGLFELAHGGTLFLDEINSMDIALQSKILKALEEKKIRRIGAESCMNIDVRVISAMNVNPIEAIRNNLIRSDLFYRIGVIQIELPSLIEKKEDIMLLTDYFISRYNKLMNRRISHVTKMVEKTFHNYSWPGNVRELKNALEAGFNLSTSNEISLRDIPEHIIYNESYNNGKHNFIVTSEKEERSLDELVNDFEKEIIIKALLESKNMSQAAKKLKITRQSLRYKMDKFNL